MSLTHSQLSFTIGLCCASCFAFSSGFQIWEQDAAGIGDYHAGAAVDTDNTGIEFYNPGAMVFMKHEKPQISTGFAYIPLDVKFKGYVNETAPPFPPSVISGPTKGWVSGNTENLIPNLHLIYPINPRWAVGFGVTTPFGLATNYPTKGILGQVATRTQLKTINFNPSVAYKITNWLGLGAGVDLQYATADFDDIVPTIPTYKDTNHLTSWAWGWNIGAYIKASDRTQLGISYRSAITHHAKGTNKLYSDSIYPTSSRITTTLPLPATLYMSIQQLISPKWTLVASTERTWWHCFDSLTLKHMQNPIPIAPRFFDLISPFGYKDTWNVALGAHYWATERWMLKLGGGYDWTPTNDKYRDIRLPGTNRWAASIGAHFVVNQHVTWDGGWTHLFPVHDAIINNQGPQGLPPLLPPPTGSPTTVSTTGIAKTNANVIGMQLTYLF